MKIVVGFVSAAVWLLVLLSGMYWGVSADVGTDGWVGMFFLLTLSLAVGCSGALLLLWSPQYPRLQTPGWLLLGCALLFWLGDGLAAALLMLLPCLAYAGWAVWTSFAEFMSKPPALPRADP